MSDAFSLGIRASMENRQSRDAQAATFAQIYSNMLLQTASMEESRARAKMQMYQNMAEIDAGLQREQIQQAGANTRTQLTLEAGIKKGYLDKTLDLYKDEMDARQDIEKTLFTEKLKGENELAKQRLVNEGNLATTILNNRKDVTTATLNNKTQLYYQMIEAGYGPDQAKIIMDKYMDSLGATYGIFQAIGPSPKTKLAGADFELKRQQARVLYGEPLYDPKTGKPVPGTGGLHWQQLEATKNDNYVRSLGIFSENTKNSMEMRDNLQKRIFAVAKEKGGDESFEAANMQKLLDLSEQLADDPTEEKKAIYKQLTAQIMGQSVVPAHLWKNFMGVQAMLSYNMMRSADVLGVGLQAMPTNDMVNEFHNKQDPEVKGLVEKTAGWLYNVIIPGGVRSIAEKGFNSLAQVGVGTNINLDSEIINGLKKAGAFKGKQTITQLNGMNPDEKIAMIQQLAAVNPELQQSAKDTVLAYRGLTSLVGEALVGDLSTQNPFYKEGHYGLVGDAALYAVGAKLLGPLAKGGWKYLAPYMRKAPIVGGTIQKIEAAAAEHSYQTVTGWGPQYLKEFGNLTPKPSLGPGGRNIPFPTPNNVNPGEVFSNFFKTPTALRTKLQQQGVPETFDFASQKFGTPRMAPPSTDGIGKFPGMSKKVKFVKPKKGARPQYNPIDQMGPMPTNMSPAQAPYNPTLTPTPVGPSYQVPTFQGMPPGVGTQLPGGFRFEPGLERIQGGYRAMPPEIQSGPVGIPEGYLPPGYANPMPQVQQQLNLEDVIRLYGGQ